MRQYVRDFLVPTATQRSQISEIYVALKACLGETRCIQIGSVARETSVRPPHDLDVLFTVGRWTGSAPDPAAILRELESVLQGFRTQTFGKPVITVQTHSVTLSFVVNGEEVFAVDVVPALEDGKNEFGEPMYRVPEIVRFGHTARRRFELEVKRNERAINWIKSDPRGYASAGRVLHERNSDFRPSARFVKGWRARVKQRRPNFALKAFHVEQVIAGIIGRNEASEIAEAVALFLDRLPTIMSRPQVPDRADGTVFIDEYVRSLTPEERREVEDEGREFLRQLRFIAGVADVEKVLGARPAAAPSAESKPATRVAGAAVAGVAPSIIRNPARPWA